MIVDLHIHTLYSDGGLTVDEIVKEAKKKQVNLISITDHNTFLCYKRKQIKGINYITGMEIDVAYKNKIFHMILYNFNLNSTLLKKYYINNRRYEIRCFYKMLKELKEKYDIVINPKKVKRFIKRNNYFDRVRLNNLLVECGICDTPRDAYYKYTKNIKSHKRKSISLKELIRLEKDTKGIVSLAHPLHYNLDISSMKKIILDLKNNYGLKVVEAINNRESIEEENELVEFCNKNKLLISAGSDTHYKMDSSNDTKEIGLINNRKVTDLEANFLKSGLDVCKK